MKPLAILVLLISISQLAQGQQKVTIDFNKELLPKLTIKRGDMFRAETNGTGTIKNLVGQGYHLYLGHRNYNEPLGNADNSCGIPAEFYIENETIKFRLNPNMTSIRTFAGKQNIQVFQQFNRVPLSGSFKDAKPEGAFDIFTFQEGWYRNGVVDQGRPDGLLPITEQYEIFADVVSKYIIACDSAAGINSIWTGFDEPAHTLGFRAGQKNDAGLELNVKRYVEFFAPLAKKLKAAGKTIGGIQLNAANASGGLYQLATAEMKRQGVYIDYFTIQNYKGGFNNKTVINEARKALSDPYWKDTKVFFNRYGYWQGVYVDESNVRNSSREMISFLNGEKIIVDNADIMYGYAMEAKQFSDNNDKMIGQLGMFLNSMPEERKYMTFESADLDGFSSTNDSVLMAVIWNKSGTHNFSDFKLALSNLPGNWDVSSIRKGSGTSLSKTDSYQWNSNILSGMTLKPYDFLLITLNKSEVQSIIKKTNNAGIIDIYPNPAHNYLNFTNTTGNVQVCVYNLRGELLKNEKLTSSNELDISDLPAGMYILKVQDFNQSKTIKLTVF